MTSVGNAVLFRRVETLLLIMGNIARKKHDTKMLNLLSEAWEYVVNLEYNCSATPRVGEELRN